MAVCMRVDLSRSRNVDEITNFLHNQDLKYEVLDSLFVVIDEEGRWLASGGRRKNVLKGFAVIEEYRSEALMDLILTELIKESYQLGIERLFVFTKAIYAPLFSGFGFQELANTGKSSLLLRSDDGVDGYLEPIAASLPSTGELGAVVMNANPFTLGHQYLAQSAAQAVDHLVVFVVENDESQFSTADRFLLVKKGLAHIPNITVILGSPLIVSAATFPSYFLKEKETISMEHARIDALVFKNYFVPRLRIRTRFLGEEPLDPSTAIYNLCLAQILPPECEVHILKRLETGEDVISATRVRRLFNEGKLLEIKPFVPEVTYHFLEELYAEHS